MLLNVLLLQCVLVLLSRIEITSAVDVGGINSGGGSSYGECSRFYFSSLQQSPDSILCNIYHDLICSIVFRLNQFNYQFPTRYPAFIYSTVSRLVTCV